MPAKSLKTMMGERDKLLEQKKTTLEDLEGKYGQLNYDIEKKRLKELMCGNCEKKLSISDEDIEDMMHQGTTIREYVCPECDMINRVKIVFEDEPTVSQAVITVFQKGLKFRTRPPRELDEKELVHRLLFEVKMVDEAKSKMDPQFQFLVKYLDLIFDELGVYDKILK